MAGALAAATLIVALLERAVHVPYAAPVYLLAVLGVGVAFGTVPAVLTSIAAFLLYDFFFVPPFYELTVADPNEWLNLLLFLAVAAVIGRMAALLSARAEEAAERAREAQALYAVSRSLVTAGTVEEAAPQVLARLIESTGMDRIWLGLGPTPSDERIVADTDGTAPCPSGTWRIVLGRSADEMSPTWVRTHLGGRGRPLAEGTDRPLYQVRLQAAGETLGSLWATRSAGKDEADVAETRILSAVADQLGQAVRRDRLAADAVAAEIARQSDALKTALLDSVSHDLRTPLTTIRAAAGSLLDPKVAWSKADQHAVVQSIDDEAERLNRLVRNLLDLSRIEGGALRPELEPQYLDELVYTAVERARRSAPKTIDVDVPKALPPVVVDDLYLDQVLTNLLENAMRYGGNHIRVVARDVPGDGTVELAVEDDGYSVPDEALPHLFEKFYRVRRPGEGSRRGMGLGLTVVKGLVVAMRGTVEARRSTLGGLGVTVRLPAASPDREPGETARITAGT